jgi:tetratricopeptide (TPR) repeat protein
MPDSVDARMAVGLQVGEHNTQYNYYPDQPVPTGAPRQLPRDRADFTGRARELAALKRRLTGKSATVLITSVAGQPGVGKSALAVHLARQLASRYPHAQLYADLRGADTAPIDSGDILAGFLRALGTRQIDIPARTDDRAAAYRSLLSRKRALIVLDNAADESQVRPLLPGAQNCLVIVTSRRDLVIDDAEPFVLEALDNDEAVEMFSRVAGSARAAAEAQATQDVVDLCGRLPLAIQIAAARLRKRSAWPVSYLAERLSDERRRLAELSVSDLDIRVSFSISYDELRADEASLFRLLGAVPGQGIDIRLAAAVAGATVDDIDPLMERLADAHLIEASCPGRYVIHDLVHLFARERLADEGGPAEVARAVREAGRWYAEMSEKAETAALSRASADGATEFDQQTSLTWLDTEWANGLSAAEAAAEADPELAVEIMRSLFSYLTLRGNYAALGRLGRCYHEIGEQLGQPALVSRAALIIGNALTAQEVPEALDWYERAVREAERADEDVHLVHALVGLVAYLGNKLDDTAALNKAVLRLKRLVPKTAGTMAAAVAARTLSTFYAGHDDVSQVVVWTERSYELAVEAKSPTAAADAAVQLGCLALARDHADGARSWWARAIEHAQADRITTEARIHNEIGTYCLKKRRLNEACGHLESALELHQRLGDRRGQAGAMAELARAYLFRNAPQESQRYAEGALGLAREFNDPSIEGRCLLLLASAMVAQGNHAAAIPSYEQAHRLLLSVEPDMAAVAKEQVEEIRLACRKRPR